MSEFDPYYKWLGIPPKDQPPNHYRLLGIELFESDPDVVDAAAEQRMSYVNQCAMGTHTQYSQQLLNELASARICLLNPARKSEYDTELRLHLDTIAAAVELLHETPVVETPVAEKPVVVKSAVTKPPVEKPVVEKPVANDSIAEKLVEPRTVKTANSKTTRQQSVPPAVAKSKQRFRFSWRSWQLWLIVASLGIGLGFGLWQFWSARKADELARKRIADKKQQEADDLEAKALAAKVADETARKQKLAADAKAKAEKIAEEIAANARAEEKRKREDQERIAAAAKLVEQERRMEMERRDAEARAAMGPPKPFDATRSRSEVETQLAQQAWATHLQSTVADKNSIGMELALIPPGTFEMGDRGQVTVELKDAFWVGTTEVTQQQWFRIMEVSPWLDNKAVPNVGEDYPAMYVNWRDAREFCRRLSVQEGFTYRLLTEAEWEYACRAGALTRFSFGDDESQLRHYGRYGDDSISKSDWSLNKIGKFRPNAFGLYDMHGNIWEWCQDRYLKDLPGGLDPVVTSGRGTRMVARGGDWKSSPGECSSFSRDEVDCLGVKANVGFRIAREFKKPAPLVKPASLNGDTPPLFDVLAARTAAEVQQAWAEHLNLKVTESNSIGMDLVLIPPGKFKMGSPILAGQRRPENEASVSVTLTRPFQVSRTEVTQKQWWTIALSVPWEENKKGQIGDNYAATNMTWNAAQKFCAELSRIEGAEYRLMTEAEWEFACRAGTTTQFCFGDDPSELNDFAWFEDNCVKVKELYAHEVALKRPNPFGLYDMHGNVMEWCVDVYSEKAPGGDNPLITQGDLARVCRGGRWSSNASSCRCANRSSRNSPDEKFSHLGFRVVRVVPNF